MEYLLQLEERQRYLIFGIGIAVFIMLMMLGMLMFGWYSPAAFGALLFFALVTPFLMNKYKFFIYLWFFGLPIGMVLYNIFDVSVGEKNPVIFLVIGLSLPFAIILFYRDAFRVCKDLPFLKYLIFFAILILINLFRPSTYIAVCLDQLKVIVFAIFIIMCSYFYIKNNDKMKVFNIYTFWVLINCIVAFFQKITGVGLMIVDGYPRVSGFSLHPNGLSGVLMLYLALFTYIVKVASKKSLKYFYTPVALMSVLGVLLTLNKYAIINLGIIFIFFIFDLSKTKKIKLLIYVPLLLISFILLNNFLELNFIENIISRFSKDNSSTIWRLKMWGDVISLLDFKSTIIGLGPGAISNKLVSLGPHNSNLIHNGSLDLISSYGIFGLSYMYFYISFILYTIKGLLKYKDKKLRSLLKLILLLSIIILIKVNMDQALFSRLTIYPLFFFITVAYVEVNQLITLNKQDQQNKREY